MGGEILEVTNDGILEETVTIATDGIWVVPTGGILVTMGTILDGSDDCWNGGSNRWVGCFL